MENQEQKVEEVARGLEEQKKPELSIKNSSGARPKKSPMQYIDVRIVSLFVIGFLLGFLLKTQAAKTIVMGANDYKLEKTKGDYLLTGAIPKQEDQQEVEEVEEVETESEQETEAGEVRQENLEKEEEVKE